MQRMCTQTTTSVYTLIRKSFGENGVRTHFNSKGNKKSPLPVKFSPEEDRTHNAASSRTVNPTHYLRATSVPCPLLQLFLFVRFAGCLTSQQHTSVSQGRICSDNFTCCHNEIEVAHQTFQVTQSQCTDTGGEEEEEKKTYCQIIRV